MQNNKMLTWDNILDFTSKENPTPDRRDERTKEQWKKVLNKNQFHITREHGTESPFSGEHCSSHEPGKYFCVCCNILLFDSTEKFNSGTGWPSFTQPVKDNAIKYIKDGSWGMVRVEVQCNVCDAHLGHIFPDGPAPGGLRYCINSLCLIKQP